MNRSTYAAVVLAGEVMDLFPGLGYSNADKDGLGVYRSVVFYGEVAEDLDSLVKILELVAQTDHRVEGVHFEYREITVKISESDTTPWTRDPFHLAAVKGILDKAEAEKPAPKKRAAKKSAARKVGDEAVKD